MEQLNFNIKDKEFLVDLLSVNRVGRKTARKILVALKKYEMKNDQFWVNKNEIWRMSELGKGAINGVNKYKNEQEIGSKYVKIIKKNIRVIAFWEKEYPPLLRETYDFPLLLFVVGNYKLLTKDSIGVVGTRKITSYGELATKKIVSDLVANNMVIISGFMYGVDLAAHLAAINSGGQTVGVLGFGFDHMYPENHKRIFKDLLGKGACFITEYLPEVGVERYHFPERNRIVAGISKGVVIVEAAQKSGTHITARCALEEGREVFAVSGPFNSPYALGVKWLINQGAKMITSGLDVVAEFEDYYKIRSSSNKL